jgi:hypothetical protein
LGLRHCYDQLVLDAQADQRLLDWLIGTNTLLNISSDAPA